VQSKSDFQLEDSVNPYKIMYNKYLAMTKKFNSDDQSLNDKKNAESFATLKKGVKSWTEDKERNGES
jgi:hypothetical protein